MTKRSTMAWAACVVVAAGLAGPARAGDAACLWRGMPPENRDAFLAAYADDGQKAFSRLEPSNEVYRLVLIACGVRAQAKVEPATTALIAYARDEAAARVLDDRYHLTRAQIDEAWLSLPPSRQAAFSMSVATNLRSGPTETVPIAKLRQAALPTVELVAKALGVTQPRAINLLTEYLIWKVATPFYEAKF
jgi:hypothetical protein